MSSPPSEVWAEFTEPPAPGSTLKVYDGCGAQVDNGDSRVEGFRFGRTAGGDGLDLARDTERPKKGLMDGIEWGEFAFALAIAAVIGAAGGKVYAGIVGPRR